MSRVALVTGASRGIGAEIARVLRNAGVEVLAPTRQELDLLSSESIDGYCRRLESSVDILVNNAGINRLGSSSEITDEDISDVLNVNLVAPLQLIRGIVPGMKARGYGRIVNISSIWSVISRERRLVYSGAKSGINGITRALAVELAPFGILVNAIAPGYVNTEMTSRNNSPEELAAICGQIPAGRLAEPVEIAELVAFLSSEKNTYMTGQVVVADGGLTYV